MNFNNIGDGILIIENTDNTRNIENKDIKTAQSSILSLLNTLDETISLIEETSSPDYLEKYIKQLNNLTINNKEGFFIPLKVIEEINSKSVEEVFKSKELNKKEKEKKEKERKLKYEKILEGLPEFI